VAALQSEFEEAAQISALHLLDLSTANNTLHIVTIALISWAAAITVAIAIMVAVVIRKATLIKTRARRLAGMKLRPPVVDSDWQPVSKESGSLQVCGETGETRSPVTDSPPVAGVRSRRLIDDNTPGEKLPQVEDARPSSAAAALADRLMSYAMRGGGPNSPTF